MAYWSVAIAHLQQFLNRLDAIIILKSQSHLSQFLLNPHYGYDLRHDEPIIRGEMKVTDKKDQLVGRSQDAPTVKEDMGDVAAFLAKAKLVRTANFKQGRSTAFGRLIFALDATMSRQPTWDIACSLQSELFDVAAKDGGLAMQLAYFRGANECRASRWTRDAKDMIGWMERFECRAGRTQLGRLLTHILKEASEHRVDAVVYVGDCLEEDPDKIVGLAGDIGLHKIPVFLFQEGDDPLASTVFREAARLTGGAYGQFDPSARNVLARYLRAIARFAASQRDVTHLPSDLRKQLPAPGKGR